MNKKISMQGKLKFGHKTEFPCVKQPTNSTREAYYAIHHMREFVRDQQRLMLPSSLQTWAKDMANYDDADLRLEFCRIQQKIAQLIQKDVCHKEGMFYYGLAPPRNDDIKTLLEMQGDDRGFNTLNGIHPFPPIKPS